ncbi:SDR family oxidoreductase [Frigoriglobus tundricola]|uniref:Enoyl-[acyl-carrier-protein] reductase [NADH] n=1 Tax=Frigoriglobus tundricola TaxID=2774151 RepID=A0A6M5YQ49_9BACT|nr:SDR family oxidoreductase [Frigoriglobus tundricola]QJW96048.1 Enoyl-[acyl-carrier-protein] reductase [NADH] [Frigoriglobus tundricola]
MIAIDLSGKVALVSGVGDNISFAWFIAKALQAAGAKVVLACHPRVMGIVEGVLTRDADKESRLLPDGSEFKPVKVYPCDANYDTMADVPEEVRTNRRYAQFPEYSIKGTVDAVAAEFGGIDIMIHSMAFSSEIKNALIDTSRKAYHEAMGISSYSLISMVRAAAPHMANRPGGGSVVGLTYVAGERVVPHYGGGMGTCKAALQMDAKQLAWFVGDKNVRVNLISAGPYASRAARAINKDFDKLIQHAADHSPLRRPIEPEEVANGVLFLCSPLAAAVTGQILYVDCGYNIMGS